MDDLESPDQFMNHTAQVSLKGSSGVVKHFTLA